MNNKIPRVETILSRQQTRSGMKATYLLLSFIIPFIVMLIALAGLRITPFGDQTLLISDANYLYTNFLAYAGRMLRGKEGIIYSLEKGLGGNMTAHLNGILLTPFGFLFSLVSISDYPVAFTFVSLLNFSLSGLIMYIFLSDLHGNKADNLIFSTSYALMGFNIANVFQAVFYCAAAPLPIMALGLRKLFQGKSPLLYIASIAYGMATNAYFGFVLCMASVLFFFTGLVFHWKEIRPGRLFIRYALASLSGGLISAILWLPGFLSLQGGRLDQTTLADFSFQENMPFLQIGAKFFSGANTTNELMDGLPNVFIGILPLALVVLFFISKCFDRRKKTAACFLVVFYLVSFWNVALNMLMHAGTTTNWFNYRYSYVFSFLLLVIASETWERIEEVPLQDVKRSAAILFAVTILIFFRKYEFIIGGVVLLDLVLLSLAYLSWRMRLRRPEVNSRRTLQTVTLLIVCINLFLNCRICTKNILEWGTTLSEYRNTVDNVAPIVQAIKESDDSLYRMEINRQRSGTTGNDPMLYGYNGVGHGGSNERNFVRYGLSKLGIPWFDMRNYYADGIPAATDALLGIKYVVAEEDLTAEKGYPNLTNTDGWNIYLDPYAMQIAILASSDVLEIQTDYEDVFDNLNKTWASLGATDDVLMEETDVVFETHNQSDSLKINSARARELVALEGLDTSTGEASASDSSSETDDTQTARALKEPPKDQSYIKYHWIAEHDGNYYSYNRSGLMDTHGSYAPVLCYEGYYHKGEEVTGYLPVSGTFVPEYVLNDVAGRFRVACANEEALANACDAARAQSVVIRKEDENRIVGEFSSEGNGQLVFTIPWDEGWTCYIDGMKNELQQVLSVFMAVDVPEGHHTFEMRYMPSGLIIGGIISAIAFIVTIVYLGIGKRYIGWWKILRKMTTGDTAACSGEGSADT